MSLATNSLLNLCAAAGWAYAGLDDRGAGLAELGAGDTAPEGAKGGKGGKGGKGVTPPPLICTATEPGEGQDQARAACCLLRTTCTAY